ncbi:MAG: hypothetical protein HKN76_21265 [Saprospiraceae bacterium]|nr:hypothetical protein [Saprospiraceae bacterium]
MGTEKNWRLLFRSPSQLEISLLKGHLHKRHIPAVEINKKDSMYVVFGEIDLMVPKANFAQASEILIEFRKEIDAANLSSEHVDPQDN